MNCGQTTVQVLLTGFTANFAQRIVPIVVVLEILGPSQGEFARWMLLSPDSNCQAAKLESCGFFFAVSAARTLALTILEKINKNKYLKHCFSFPGCLYSEFFSPVEKSYPQVLQDFAHIL